MAAITQYPMPPATADLATTWAFLEEGVDHIMTKLHTGVSYTKYMNYVHQSLTTTARHQKCTALPHPSSLWQGDVSPFSLPALLLLIYPPAGANLMGSDLYNSLVRYFVQHLRHLRDVSYRCYDDWTLINDDTLS